MFGKMMYCVISTKFIHNKVSNITVKGSRNATRLSFSMIIYEVTYVQDFFSRGAHTKTQSQISSATIW